MGTANSKDVHWQEDSEAPECHNCHVVFSISVRRHHCRNCGYVFCRNCSNYNCAIPSRGVQTPVRVCRECFRMLSVKGNKSGSTGNGGPITTGFSNENNGLDGNKSLGRSSVQYGGTDASYVDEASSLTSGTVMDNNWENDKTCFVGSGNSADVNENSADVAEAYYNSYTKINETPITIHTITGDKGADQIEKELLMQRWMEVRQRAIFTDILLQQVERVDEYTEVECFQEIENIMLQPEEPDLLRVMFPFPEAMEGNAELLMEPVTRNIPLLEERSEMIEETLRELATKLTLLPVPSIRTSESALLHQV
ncbi:FYVE zinc finger [Trypanosoma melophagium]|uniref:FYVE zinc finger n=1 Tax=Trypanosoma melophagium TaxID=715481 RepID=UPI00351A184E|nr:FYVE zinc finger [Trypanosoma melophagium]